MSANKDSRSLCIGVRDTDTVTKSDRKRLSPEIFFYELIIFNTFGNIFTLHIHKINQNVHLKEPLKILV